MIRKNIHKILYLFYKLRRDEFRAVLCVCSSGRIGIYPPLPSCLPRRQDSEEETGGLTTCGQSRIMNTYRENVWEEERDGTQ